MQTDINQIIDKLKITPNSMQEEAIHAILHTGKDVVVLSPTGSGKTLAYLLPLSQLLDADDELPQAVVVTPGRELALQSATVFKDMGTGLRAMAVYGGRPTMEEHRVLRDVRPQLVFGTPGRLNDHLDKGNLSADHVRYLIIDEFDKCLEMGFQDEMHELINKLYRVDRHILLSATDAEEIPSFLHLRGKNDMVRVDFLDHDEQVPDRVTVYAVHSPEKDKLGTLRNLLLSFGEESSIVFLNYRESVERVDNFLREAGFTTSAFHGGLDQKAREQALYKFSNGSANVLVATDLASRGLDIPSVDHIIHYHLPESEDGYIHRVGRTARWQATGNTFFILSADEQIPEYVDAAVEDFALEEQPSDRKPAAPKMATVYIGKGKKDKISKGDILGFLCKKGGLKGSEIGRIDVKDRYCYAAVSRPRLHALLRQVQGEKIKGIKTVVEEID